MDVLEKVEDTEAEQDEPSLAEAISDAAERLVRVLAEIGAALDKIGSEIAQC